MRFSKSRLLNYINCPYRFKLDYIMKLKDWSEEPEEGSPLRIGLDLHSIFENYYSLAYTPEPPYDENIYKALMDVEDAYKYEDHIQNFAQFNADVIKYRGVENYRPLTVETEMYDDRHDFIGIIDRVDSTPYGDVILDYKTSKNPSAYRDYDDPYNDPMLNYGVGDRVRKSLSESQYSLELTLYKMLYEYNTHRKVYKVGIYFSKKNIMTTMTVTEKDEERALRILGRVRELIDEEQFPRKRGWLCRFCEYAGVICRGGGYDDA